MRTLLVRTLLVASIGLATLSGTAAPASAEDPTIVHQANILGFNRAASADRGDVRWANMVIEKVYAKSPLVVTVNEVCLSQYYEMVAWLGAGGWTGRWNKQIETNGIGDWPDSAIAAEITRCGNQFGTAVFTKGYLGTGNTYTDSYGPQRSGDGTVRGFACVRGGIYLRVWSVCATHLTNTPSGSSSTQRAAIREVRRAQDDVLRNHLYSWGSGTNRLAGGDFNDAPGFFWPWDSSYDEVDDRAPWSGGNRERVPRCVQPASAGWSGSVSRGSSSSAIEPSER